jgi:membrane associated rhomboid family serine protease
MIAGSLLAIVGTQVVGLGLCAHAYGTYYLGEKDPWFDRMRARFRLEHGLMLGAAVAVMGVVFAAVVVGKWIDSGFGALSEVRLAILAATFIVVGIQIFFSSFLISIIGLRRSVRLARPAP